MENRETVIIPEKKSKILNIKKKYNKLNMSDNTAKKIITLEIANKVLITASIIAGVITVIDLFVPDPVLGLDEAALTGITTLLGTSTSIVKNKINDLVENDNVEISMEEIEKLSGMINNVATSVKNKSNNSRFSL